MIFWTEIFLSINAGLQPPNVGNNARLFASAFVVALVSVPAFAFILVHYFPRQVRAATSKTESRENLGFLVRI